MPRSFFRLLLLLLLTSLPALCRAQQSSVLATADTAQIQIGDPVRVQLEARHAAADGGMSWPLIPDSLGHLEVIDRSPIDTLHNEEYTIYRQRLTVTGYDSGGYYIPSFRFRLEGDAGTAFLATDSLPLLVQSVPVDTGKPIMPLRPVIEAPLRWYERPAVLVGLAALALLLAAGLVYLFIRRRRKTIAERPVPPPVPAHERALQELRALEQEGLWQSGAAKEYYVRLTGILRRYIHERFGLAAQERTSGELLADMRSHPELNGHAAALAAVLRTADAAKFARAQPEAREHTEAMATAIGFVERTVPQPLAEAPADSSTAKPVSQP